MAKSETKHDRSVKIIQIAAHPAVPGPLPAPGYLYALCDDGSLWAVSQPGEATMPEDWFQIAAPEPE